MKSPDPWFLTAAQAASMIEHDISDEQIVAQFALMVRVGGVEALNDWMRRLHDAAVAAAAQPLPTPVLIPGKPAEGHTARPTVPAVATPAESLKDLKVIRVPV